MLTHKQVRDEMEILVKSVTASEEIPISLLKATKHALYMFFFSELLIMLSMVVEYFNFYKIDGASAFALGFNVLLWVFVSAGSVSYTSVLAMIPLEVRRDSKLLLILEDKFRLYVKFLIGLWSLVTVVMCVMAGGGAIFILGSIVISLFISVLLFNMDVSRYQISGFWGALQAAKNKWNEAN